jgi:hypothetical protein
MSIEQAARKYNVNLEDLLIALNNAINKNG